MAGGASHPARTAARQAAAGYRVQGGRAAAGPSAISVDAQDFRKVLLATQDFDKKLYAALRKRLRTLGRDLINDMQGELDASGPMTRAIAAGLKASISKGNANGKGAGLRIRATATKLPDGKKQMIKAYNKAAFRHPVFGDRNVWLEQPGRPYFGKVIIDKREAVADGVRLALAEALRDMAAAGPR